jgi:hypothetical protein
MNKIIFTLFALMFALNVGSPARSSSFKHKLIRGVKFPDDIKRSSGTGTIAKAWSLVGKGFGNISSIAIVELAYSVA